jgi:hypothetical protein
MTDSAPPLLEVGRMIQLLLAVAVLTQPSPAAPACPPPAACVCVCQDRARAAPVPEVPAPSVESARVPLGPSTFAPLVPGATVAVPPAGDRIGWYGGPAVAIDTVSFALLAGSIASESASTLITGAAVYALGAVGLLGAALIDDAWLAREDLTTRPTTGAKLGGGIVLAPDLALFSIGGSL